MNMKTLLLFAVVPLSLTLGFSTIAPAAPNAKSIPALAHPAASSSAPAATPAPPHAEIREALASLRRARMHLQEAKHDFGGHRADALRATDEAIRQLEFCLKFE